MSNIDRSTYAPFLMMENDSGSFSLILSDHHMVEKCPIFEENEGWLGNGYDWNSVAQVVMAERLSDLEGKIDFDPEAGMFCAYGPRAPLDKLAAEMHKVWVDDSQLRDLLSRAELD